MAAGTISRPMPSPGSVVILKRVFCVDMFCSLTATLQERIGHAGGGGQLRAKDPETVCSIEGRPQQAGSAALMLLVSP